MKTLVVLLCIAFLGNAIAPAEGRPDGSSDINKNDVRDAVRDLIMEALEFMRMKMDNAKTLVETMGREPLAGNEDTSSEEQAVKENNEAHVEEVHEPEEIHEGAEPVERSEHEPIEEEEESKHNNELFHEENTGFDSDHGSHAVNLDEDPSEEEEKHDPEPEESAEPVKKDERESSHEFVQPEPIDDEKESKHINEVIDEENTEVDSDHDSHGVNPDEDPTEEEEKNNVEPEQPAEPVDEDYPVAEPQEESEWRRRKRSIQLFRSNRFTKGRPNGGSDIKNKFATRNSIDDMIKKALEYVRMIMANGTIYSPPLDPFVIEELIINFESPDAKLLLKIDKTLVTHMSEFIIDYVITNVIRFTLNMQLTVPKFYIDGHYAMDGTLLQIVPLYGSGNFFVHVENVTLGGGGALNLTSGVSVKNLKLNFTFAALTVKFENLNGGGSMEAIVETVINDLAKTVVDTVWGLINEPFCRLVEAIINEFLAGMSPGDIGEKEINTLQRMLSGR